MAKRKKRKHLLISAVAERFEIHPQTLRLYEREGLITPPRSAGNTRLYDDACLERLQTILNLTRDMGVNLAGVEVILKLMDQLDESRRRLADLEHSVASDQGPNARVRRRYSLVRLQGGPLVPREGD